MDPHGRAHTIEVDRVSFNRNRMCLATGIEMPESSSLCECFLMRPSRHQSTLLFDSVASAESERIRDLASCVYPYGRIHAIALVRVSILKDEGVSLPPRCSQKSFSSV